MPSFPKSYHNEKEQATHLPPGYLRSFKNNENTFKKQFFQKNNGLKIVKKFNIFFTKFFCSQKKRLLKTTTTFCHKQLRAKLRNTTVSSVLHGKIATLWR